jgi:predicted dehydrogenase
VSEKNEPSLSRQTGIQWLGSGIIVQQAQWIVLMNKSKYKVAIISAGRMASTIDDEIREMETWPSLKNQLPYSHAPCYKERPEQVEMVAVCDLDEAKAKLFCERWDVPRYYLDYREMIDTERPDIVSIAVPADLHAEMAIYAMEHGARGIYCEKSMCCSLEEADAIVDCVERTGSKFVLGAQRRNHPHFRKALEIIHSGELGGLISVTSWIESSLLHSLSHTADTSLFLADDSPASWVFGVLGPARSIDYIETRRIAEQATYDPQTKRWNGDPGCITFTAQLDNGVYLIHRPAITDNGWEATCENGSIRIINNNESIEIVKRRGTSYSFDPVALPPIPHASSNLMLIDDLIDSLAGNKKPCANELVGRHGMELLMGVAQSHLEGGRKVSLPLDNRAMYIPSH